MAVRSVCMMLVVGAALAMPISAQSQALPGGVVPPPPSIVPDPSEVVGGAVGTVTSTTGDVAGLGSTSDAAASSVGGLIGSPLTSTGDGTSTGSGSSRADARTGSKSRPRAGREYKSRFDRLPRRLELLLERIELGRHVQANLRRLEALLADSPGLRAQVLRALEAELARLRAGDVTPAEHRRIDRLVFIRTALTAPLASPAPAPAATGVVPVDRSPVEHAGGVSPAISGSEPSRAESGRHGSPILSVPETDGKALFWAGILLLSLGLLAIATGVTSHVRRSLREG
jgi:hypothetical protein